MNNAFPKVSGFDRLGEPELRSGEAGELELVFNTMPPSTSNGVERSPELFETFELVLADELGVPVVRDDREVFIIAKPKPDTAQRLAEYLSAFWTTHAKSLAAKIESTPRSPNSQFPNLKSFHVAIVDRFKLVFAAFGFKKAVASRFRDSHFVHFIRKSTNGTQTISIGGGHLAPYLNPIISLSVTDLLVETIYGPFGNQADTPEAWQYNSLNNRLLMGADGFNFLNFRYVDFQQWSDQALERFSKQGISIFDEMSNRELTERQFNDTTIEPPEYLKSHSDNIACRGLILAKLLKRHDINLIAAYHRKHLATLLFETSYTKLESYLINKKHN